MSVDYVQLNELQNVISDIFDIEGRINDLSQNLSDKDAVLQKSRLDYLQIKKRCESLTEEVAVLKAKHIQAGKEREKKERMVETITAQREFDNLRKEIEEYSREEQSCLKSFNSKSAVLEEQKTRLQVSEDFLNSQEKELEELKKETEISIKTLEESLKRKQSERSILCKDLPQNLLFKFERIIKNKEGIGVVALHGIICQGCHMELPQQFAITVRKNEEINFCPYCSRILYYEKSDEDEKYINQIHGDVQTNEKEDSYSLVGSDENLFDDI